MNSFEFLQDILLNKEIIDIDLCQDPFTTRFLKAYQDKFSGRSKLDIAILLRQILLHENTQRKNHEKAVLFLLENDYWPEKNIFEKVGINCSYENEKIRLSASFWKPVWLKSSEDSYIEFDTVSMFNIRKTMSFERKEEDLFLRTLGLETYNSLEQKKAIRNALSLEPGKTLAISLPTGEGKSLIFQAISKIGFFDSQKSGVTIVIVPTVSLALDHEKSMQNLFKTDELFAYISEDTQRKEEFKSKIKDGSKSIIFTSPEAVYSSLRKPLIEASKSGLLRAIVVDEAHIINEWGNDFRHEFQIFSGLWRQLLNLSPQGNTFRTLMLSATYTQEAIDIIEKLFTKDHKSFEVYYAAKVRPEIDYWVGSITNKEEQMKRLVESINYLPRPLIVYASTHEDAEMYFNMIRKDGFYSVALLHGGSTPSNRAETVSKWKEELIDIVVGTSAFGMGIDYAHVRSVVHACVPETINRFYQEVGRGGRDGCYSLSLVLPTNNDKEVAKRINRTTTIGNFKGIERWKAMFENKHLDEETGVYIVDIGAPPAYDRDLESIRHYKWNFQVLNLMARAGLIQLEGVPYRLPYSESPERFILVSIQNENHSDESIWSNAINSLRTKIYQANENNLKLMYHFLEERDCPTDLFESLYTIDLFGKKYHLSKNCSRCNLCRNGKRQYEQVAIAGSINKKSLKIAQPMLVLYQEEYKDRSFSRKFPKVMERLLRRGYQSLVFVGSAKNYFLDSQEKIKNQFISKPIYIEEVDNLSQISLIKKKLPQDNLVLFIGNEIMLTSNFIEHSINNNILIVPKDIKDPRSSSPRFADVFQGNIMNINDFINKV